MCAFWRSRLSALDWRRQGGRRRLLRWAAFCIFYLLEKLSRWWCSRRRPVRWRALRSGACRCRSRLGVMMWRFRRRAVGGRRSDGCASRRWTGGGREGGGASCGWRRSASSTWWTSVRCGRVPVGVADGVLGGRSAAGAAVGGLGGLAASLGGRRWARLALRGRRSLSLVGRSITPTSLSGEGHGSVFSTRDRARGAFWRHMLAKSVWTRLGCRRS
jgi:hypothetical protein